MHTTEAACAQPRSFRTDVETALAALRAALADVIHALALPNARPNELVEELGVDKSLASKIARLLESSEPLAMAPWLPGRSAVRIFLRAARKRGVSESRRSAVLDALDQLDRVANEYAGDRSSFSIMLNACAEAGDSSAAIAIRRNAFRANSYLFGVQARVQYRLAVIAPSATSGMADVVRIFGFVGMRRIRHDVAWTLARSRMFTDEGAEPLNHPRRRTLTPDDASSGGWVLRGLSSGQLPEIRFVELGNGMVEERMLQGPIGNVGAFTLFSGDLIEAVGPARRDAENQMAASTSRLHTPVELLIFDCFIHESLFREAPPTFALYSELGGPPWPACGEEKRLALPVTVHRLGRGAARAHSVDVPRCRELAQLAFKSARWNAEEFTLYRARVAFPPIPSSAVMRNELPPA